MSRRNDPRCEHRARVNLVSNLPEGAKWQPGTAHAATWVCDKRPCVLDAMAWVERITDQPAYVIGPLSALGAALS